MYPIESENPNPTVVNPIVSPTSGVVLSPTTSNSPSFCPPTALDADAIWTYPVAPAPTESNSIFSPGVKTVVPTPTAPLAPSGLPNPELYLKYS